MLISPFPVTSRVFILLTLATQAVAAPAAVEFNRDVRPILSNNCFFCHGPDKNQRKKDLRLDVRESAFGKKAIVPGDPESSRLIARIFSADPDEVMPPPESHKSLKPAEKETLRRWIAEGAEYQPHWAYIVPVRPALPGPKFKIGGKDFEASHPIDRFIFGRLEREGIAPAPEADPRTLIRRLSLDAIGLPPPAGQVEAFAKEFEAGNSTPGEAQSRIEAVVDRLLKSPHYGERMAVPWLDVVRFADTVGYHGDQNQRIFPYRDYVIDAFNRNKPFDQFTVEQIAGDLLPNPTTEQLRGERIQPSEHDDARRRRAAEGIPREVRCGPRAHASAPRGSASTFGCAECHDHKFDPLGHEGFLRAAGVLRRRKQWGVYHDYAYTPNPDLQGLEQRPSVPAGNRRSKARSCSAGSKNCRTRSRRSAGTRVGTPALRTASSAGPVPVRAGASAAATPGWVSVGAEKSADGFRAVVRGPGVIRSIRVRVPQGGFTLKLSAVAGVPRRGPGAAGEGAAEKPAVCATRPGSDSIGGCDSRIRAARYANGADILNVADEWKSDPAEARRRHTRRSFASKSRSPSRTMSRSR